MSVANGSNKGHTNHVGPVSSAAIVSAADLAFEQASDDALARAQRFAQPLLANEKMASGENVLEHANAVSAILQTIGGSQAMQAAAYLVYACAHLQRPREVIARAFGDSYADLAVEVNKLIHLQRQARLQTPGALVGKATASTSELAASLALNQTENVRKMLLAFSRDLRVVMLRLASRLQTLRYYAASKTTPDLSVAQEALSVFAPLANRLGIWQIKWEVEDLAFRFLEPTTYKDIARLLDEKRGEREVYMAAAAQDVQTALRKQGVDAQVSGRPKHIYSIVKKMRGKSLDFGRVFDIRALRIVVPDVDACYTALAYVHQQYAPILEEFDDYIAKPKPNGYQSLHTVVRDADGLTMEIQIRSSGMHEHAESGVAAHWAYKEAGAKGYSGVSASSEYDGKIAVLRQLLAWERDMSGAASGLFDDRIYVLTPNAAVVELPKGATPIDFAYAVHTNVGHRCRGARVDGAMVPLTTALQNGQTVEVVTVKEGGPSRDWLNPNNGYLVSSRSRNKVRAWFNALAAAENVAKGRELVEKTLQREGKTATKLEDLAQQLGFDSAVQLFEVVGKDELSLRAIEAQLRPAEPEPEFDEKLLAKTNADKAANKPARGGVLVVGVDSLLTQMAKCCRPAPPDPIGGFVTKGRGVSIHRANCADFLHLNRMHGDRIIEVAWGGQKVGEVALYPVDVRIEAQDRSGLLRDISDVFAREKMNVIGVNTHSPKGLAQMTFTVQITDAKRLNKVLGLLTEVSGVRSAKRH
jgi:GTP pyrophosphokinase